MEGLYQYAQDAQDLGQLHGGPCRGGNQVQAGNCFTHPMACHLSLVGKPKASPLESLCATWRKVLLELPRDGATGLTWNELKRVEKHKYTARALDGENDEFTPFQFSWIVQQAYDWLQCIREVRCLMRYNILVTTCSRSLR